MFITCSFSGRLFVHLPWWWNWYTRATQNRMAQAMRVRLPPAAPMSKPKLVVLVGPTASGKTALSIEIAKEFSGEVISADSRQVYERLDIGTEKVTAAEMQGIPHHLLDVVPPEVVYTAHDFKRDSAAAIEEILNRSRLPIVAGGTFFYVDMLLGKISTPDVPPDPALRAHLEELSTETLFTSLERLDPERAFHIDPNNKRRLMRALEIVKSEGKVPQLKVESPYDTLILGIKTDKTELRNRIRSRAEQAIERGLVTETKQLLKNGLSKERLSEIGLEYRIVLEYLDGELTDGEFIQKLEEKNWQYARKQLTWLKRDESIVWIDRTDTETVFTKIREFLG